MKRIALTLLLVLMVAPATLYAQAVGQRTSVGYLDSGYSLGYRGIGGYGYGFTNRFWGGTYGDLLYQQPTQYLNYQKPVYRGNVSSAQIAQQMYNASCDAFGRRLHRTDAWAARVMNARRQEGLPANAISTAPVNESLWLANRDEHTITKSVPLNEIEPQTELDTPAALPPVVYDDAAQPAKESQSHLPVATSQIELRDVVETNADESHPAAILVRPNTPASNEPVTPQLQSNATLAGMAVGRGDAAFHRAAYADAREHYLRATVALPDEAGPHIAHGLACFALGDYAAAARSLRTGFDRAPDLAQAEIDLRDLYGKPSDFERQVRSLDEHLIARPNHAEAWFVKGFVCHYTGKDAAARSGFQRYRTLVSEDLLADAFIDRVLAEGVADRAGD